jgi:hypothetical protein
MVRLSPRRLTHVSTRAFREFAGSYRTLIESRPHTLTVPAALPDLKPHRLLAGSYEPHHRIEDGRIATGRLPVAAAVMPYPFV